MAPIQLYLDPLVRVLTNPLGGGVFGFRACRGAFWTLLADF